MFEKEAEEYWQEQIKLRNQGVFVAKHVKDLFKECAEFGYNKANEWHDLRKDNKDLPKENMKQVMVMTNYNDCLMGWYCIHQKTWWSSDCPDVDDKIECDNIKVIKWKEIVLPKEY